MYITFELSNFPNFKLHFPSKSMDMHMGLLHLILFFVVVQWGIWYAKKIMSIDSDGLSVCFYNYLNRANYLKSVGEDDIGVHGTNIKMVNQRVLQPCRCITQITKFLFDFRTHLTSDRRIILVKGFFYIRQERGAKFSICTSS